MTLQRIRHKSLPHDFGMNQTQIFTSYNFGMNQTKLSWKQLVISLLKSPEQFQELG